MWTHSSKVSGKADRQEALDRPGDLAFVYAPFSLIRPGASFITLFCGMRRAHGAGAAVWPKTAGDNRLASNMK
ncbi:hypothetical protein [Rhizorhapis sp.]|uniref:hypothetical protein n=1 Tax=Rhizorhapis sp. TaxID=1968842 RepID=UPI002B46CC85|nr:hypothetical protein [Rhizorhapis sp.]HKR17039.1 hypothetical protein [Rhizorhapis sp.]